jgi:pilus assembly protein CpaF
MTNKELLEYQTQRGAKIGDAGDSNTRTLQAVLNDCRKRIEEESPKYRDLDINAKKAMIHQIIVDFVMDTKPMVEGYIDGENRSDTRKLVDALVADITDYGILTQAMQDDDVFEIRSNGREIKAEVKGHVDDLKDKEGKILRFSTPEQQEIILKKLLGDVRLTKAAALVNGITIEGYRIAAVHSSAMSDDPNDPTAPKFNSFVLRKFHKTKLKLGDIVKFHTMSDNMARTLALSVAGGLTFFTVGPTASGKTTTNNAILQSVPPYLRTVIIQNPSEIDLRMKTADGRMYNDVLHLEARDVINPTPNDPTMTNLINHTLRLSPSLVCLGEIRDNKEFKEATRILQAGHPINTTFHAESSEGAIRRYLTAYLAESGNEPSDLALREITELVNLIIVQRIMADGTRKVLQISEVLGVDPEDRNRPLLNDLYRFVVDEEPETDDEGNVIKIHGHHHRVGTLSQKTIDRFKLQGISSKRYDFLTKEVNEFEVETYTGTNIDHYGINSSN